MEQIGNIEVGPCTDSNYLTPFRVHYDQNGTRKSWDFVRTHDSVSVLIFNTTLRCFVLVKQFRPAVYMCEWERTKTKGEPKERTREESASTPDDEAAAEPLSQKSQAASSENAAESSTTPQPPPASAGVTYELCAGLVDKPDLSLEEIARQEILEECGYDVPAAELRRITSYRSGVTGSRQTMFYAEVSEEHHRVEGAGGGVPQEGELIEVVEVPLGEAAAFAYDESVQKTMGVVFGFIWFHNNITSHKVRDLHQGLHH